MLLGQDFRGSHDGDLISAFDRHEGSQKGDDGFPAAYVALEETIHGVGLAHVALNFADDPFLSRGQGEGKKTAKFLGIAVKDREGDSLFQGGSAAPQGQPDFHKKELLENQPSVGRRFSIPQGLEVFMKIRKMSLTQSRGEGNESQAPADFVRKAA